MGDLSIGERILSIRKDYGLSRDDFAKDVGISRNTLARYETGERMPSIEFLISLNEHYGFDMNWLILGKIELDEFDDLSAMEMKLVSLSRRYPQISILLVQLLMNVSLAESEKDRL